MDSLIDISLDDLMELTQRAEGFARQRRIAAVKVGDIMSTPVITVHPETTLSTTAHLLVSERISGLPVVDADNKLVGIFTEADFLNLLGVPTATSGHSLWQTLDKLFSHTDYDQHLPPTDAAIGHYMTHSVITASADDPVQTVLDLMKKHQVKRVVVIDQERQVTGIVSRSNLVHRFLMISCQRLPPEHSGRR
ncbi:MAG: CBS domain-containing protein [Thiolinea sp.]